MCCLLFEFVLYFKPFPVSAPKPGLHPLVSKQIVWSRPVGWIQCQTSLNELHDSWNIVCLNGSTGGNPAFQCFIRCFKFEDPYAKMNKDKKSSIMRIPFASKYSAFDLDLRARSGGITPPDMDISQPSMAPSSSPFSSGTSGFPVNK